MARPDPGPKPDSDVVDVTRWTHERLDWHLRICCDPALRDRAKLLASLLLHDFDLRRGGCAWRGQTGEKSLTARAGWKDARTVQLAAQELEAAGYLRIERGQGRGRSNRYWPVFGEKADVDQPFEGDKRLTPISVLEPEKADADQPFSDEKAVPDQPFPAEKADPGAVKGGSTSALHRKDSNNSLSERERIFDRLVDGCPSGMLKFADLGAARDAFERICDDGHDPGPLVAAIGRVGASPEYQSRKHPPQLNDWLAKGSWRGWIEREPPATAAAAEPAPRTPFALPDDLAAELGAIEGVAPYLARADWSDGERTIVAATTTARDRLVERIGRQRLAKWEIKVVWRVDYERSRAG